MKFMYCALLGIGLAVCQAQASHLSEEEVVALEKACQDKREEKLAPERRAAIEQCMSEGKGNQAQCTELYGDYGEIETPGVRRIGKYYDLPECEKSYKARKHFHINPGH